jgi:hypothetical protein
MAALIARESSRPDWDGPVVDLVEEDTIVGCVYVDAGDLLVEFYSDEDGEPWIYDVSDLQRVLDVAAAMLAPDEEDAAPAEPGDVDPIDQLASEIDATAARRGEEDEGFYPAAAARRAVALAEALDLAVATLEGFELRFGRLQQLPGHTVDVAAAHRGEPWALFRAGCNTQAAAVLEQWSRGRELLVAVEVEDRSGEVYVL